MIARRHVLLLILLLTSACQASDHTFPSTEPDDLALTEAPGSQDEPSPDPSLTLLPPAAACPIPLGMPAMPNLSSASNWAVEVLNYLNQGGSLSALVNSLLAPSQFQGLVSSLADLDGDGFEDFIIKLDEIPQADGEPETEHALLIYLCDQAAYRPAYALSALPDARRLELNRVEDLTGDGVPEILVMQEFCGAHTCFQAWEVLQWLSGQFLNVLTGRSDDLPSPVLAIDGPKADGSMILEITGSGAASAGAGPPRAVSRVWHWKADEGRFIPLEDRLAPATFRIHALHDADQAAHAGDAEVAMLGYQRVIEDPLLDDYPFGEDGHARLSAYALYRSMLLWIRLGDLDSAGSTLGFLREAHPPGSPGAGYTTLAVAVWEAYQAQPDLDRACQIAQAFALENPALVLEPLQYGYANRVYSAGDLCPFTQ